MPKTDFVKREVALLSLIASRVNLKKQYVPVVKPVIKLSIEKAMHAAIEEVDWELLEEDTEELRDMYAVISRNGNMQRADMLERVLKILDSLLDTAESCGLIKTNINETVL